MATNKHASIRYQALDKCFGNPGKRYFIEDLIKACNDAIYEFSGIEDGVKRRQVYEDIKYMESDQGFSIPLMREKDGKRVFYRYADSNFTISNKGISPQEAEQLTQTLSILSRFKGMPQFEWVEEIQIRLQDTFKLQTNSPSSVSFEQNPYLKGLNFFSDLFNAIQNEQCLEVTYKGYKQQKEDLFVIHPWHLKQYNNRWFLFGLNEKYEAISNLAIDRIVSVNTADQVYKENSEIDFEEYFDDVIGVSVSSNSKVERVLLSISRELWPYIDSKPIHGSQKIISENTERVLLELNVQINHELIAQLFSYLDGVEVTEPQVLREKMSVIADAVHNKYI